MARAFVASLFFVVTLSACVSTTPPERPDFTLIPDEELPRKTEDTRRLWPTLVKKYPGDPRSHSHASYALALKCEFEDAAREIRIAMDLAVKNPYFAPTPEYTNGLRGQLVPLLFITHKYKEALIESEKLVEDQPGNIRYRRMRIQANLKLENHEPALTDAEFVISSDPKSLQGFLMRSAVAYEQKRFDDAATDMTQAIILDGEPSGILLLQRGKAYAAAGAYEKAIADYDEALKIENTEDVSGFLKRFRANAVAALKASGKSSADAEAIRTKLWRDDQRIVMPNHADCEKS